MEFDATAQQRLTANPLWRWRIANRRDAREVEGALGLPPGRVQAWELGAATPRPEELRKLAGWIGVADLDAQWRAWASSPTSH
ncbi:MAG TPA: helix-turn-helix transcriptional regulator [bacterium]|nr:helix-turn-helix transcriptional regulator [bacterium]